MKKTLGYVSLNAEGMNVINSLTDGPFPIVDIDPHHGVQIKDHRGIGHWISAGSYVQIGGDHRISYQESVDRYIDSIRGQNGHVRNVHATTEQKLDGVLLSLNDAERERLAEKMHTACDYEKRIAFALERLGQLPLSIYEMQEINDVRHILKGGGYNGERKTIEGHTKRQATER